VHPVGGFVEQISSIGDMLFVATVDGKFDSKEENIVRVACSYAQITDEQLARLIKETIGRVEKRRAELSCFQCGAKIEVNARFCSSCGADVADVEAPVIAADILPPSSGFAIQFCESTAGGFPAALEFARQNPSFQTCIRNKKTWYQASWPDTGFSEALKLADHLSGIRNRRCFHNGEEKSWDDMFGCAWCVHAREAAYRPVEYCFGKSEGRLNLWGCKQARMDWADWAPWLSYGSFKKTFMGTRPNEWTFDKKRIRHELETNVYRYRNCPHLDFGFIEAVVEALPDTVCVDKSQDWKYNRTYEFSPGCIQIKEVEESGVISFSSEYYADGVRPVGFQAFLQILRTVLSKVRRDEVFPESLTGSS
jgi:hypothetical protein